MSTPSEVKQKSGNTVIMQNEGQAASKTSLPEKKSTLSQKKNWLLTYCPAGTYITPEMLKADGIDADECHSTSDRVMNYTYIHLTLKVRQTRIENFMTKIQASHGITQNEIFGYDSVKGGSLTDKLAIEGHIAFQMLLKHYKNNEPSFKPCTDGEPVLKRGILFHALDIVKERTVKLWNQNKRQLVLYAQTLEEKLEKSQNQETQFSTNPINGPKGKPPSTRSILLNYRRNREARDAMRRVIKMEKRMNKRDATNGTDHSGEIYAAWNTLMPDLHKQGFSFSDAETRVRALQTAGVLEPFKLVRSAKVPDARMYEKAMHIYFKDVRVYKRKEFFATSNEEINQFFDMVEGTGGEEDEKEQWAYALAKAQKRH